jgi:hypothetical protein
VDWDTAVNVDWDTAVNVDWDTAVDMHWDTAVNLHYPRYTPVHRQDMATLAGHPTSRNTVAGMSKRRIGC